MHLSLVQLIVVTLVVGALVGAQQLRSYHLSADQATTQRRGDHNSRDPVGRVHPGIGGARCLRRRAGECAG